MAPSYETEEGQTTESAEEPGKGERGVIVRSVQPDDWMPLAQMAYDSFLAFNESVGIPQHLDWESLESAHGAMKVLTSAPDIRGVVAVDARSGALMGAGFLHPGDVYAIGPLFVDNKFKGRGAAKALMVSMIEKAKSENAKSIRLNQITANVSSFGLYASVGFVPVECWMDFEGSVTPEQAASASRSVGFSPPTGAEVRKMEEGDAKACAELYCKAMGYDVEKYIRTGTNPWVVTQNGNIIAYTTGFYLRGHTVAETEEALVFMYTEVCRNSETGPPAILHLPGRLYPRLLRWSMAAKLKLMRQCWLMVIGSYQSPQHGMVWCPSMEH